MSIERWRKYLSDGISGALNASRPTQVDHAELRRQASNTQSLDMIKKQDELMTCLMREYLLGCPDLDEASRQGLTIHDLPALTDEALAHMARRVAADDVMQKPRNGDDPWREAYTSVKYRIDSVLNDRLDERGKNDRSL